MPQFPLKQAGSEQGSIQNNWWQKAHVKKRGQNQLLHMSHKFETHNEKVKMEDIEGGTGVLRPVLPMKLAV